jgi:hypothetical protein
MNKIETEKSFNPLEATVISLFPLEITEMKPGLYPGYYIIPPAPLGDISYLVVGDAIFYQDTKNEQRIMVKTPFHVMAESIVHDFVINHIARIPEEAEPGLFWVPGGYYGKEFIKEKFADEIASAEKKQNRWFEELVRFADDVWARTGRTSSANQLQRLAAQRLSLARPWILRTGSSVNTCPYCKEEVAFGATKCPKCREILDHAAYQKVIKEHAPTGQ